jgi:hypothetical protein
MAKFVEKDQNEPRDIFGDIPCARRIWHRSILKQEVGSDEPTPVDEYISAGETEQPE